MNKQSPKRLFLLASLLLLAALTPLAHASEPAQPYPLWDGQESVADYAKKANLPTTKNIDLGGGVKMEQVLIPAGKFVMGLVPECFKVLIVQKESFF
jgi:hypothetical protein